jgi:site-specific DNA recombinase
MIIASSGAGSWIHRYYESKQTTWSAREGIRRFRMRADRLEELVVAAVTESLLDRETMRAALRDSGRSCDDLGQVSRRAAAARANLEKAGPEELCEMLRSLIVECEISPNGLILVLRSAEVARFVAWDGIGLFRGDRAAWTTNQATHVVRRPLEDVRFGRSLVMPTEPVPLATRKEPNPALVRLVQTARRAQAAVDAERDPNIKLLARRFRCRQQRFCRLLRLNYLAPDIVSAILAGAQPEGLTSERLVQGVLPLDWDLQRRILGFPARANVTLMAKRDKMKADKQDGGNYAPRSLVTKQ